MTVPKVICSRFALLTALAALTSLVTACGSSPAPPTVYPDLSGNWQFDLEIAPPSPPSLPTNPIADLYGSLSSPGGKVTGILNAHTFGFSPCVAANADLPATGTVDAAGNLNLTTPISGGMATLSINVGDGSNRFLNGVFQVVGGPCAQPSIALSAFRVPQITGTFVGSLAPLSANGPTGPAVTVTATLVQSTAPNSDGQYPLSGTVVSTGACALSFSFTGGLVSGASFASQPLPMTFGAPNPVYFSGAIAPGNSATAQSILGGLTSTDPVTCSLQVYSGSLTRQ